MEKSLVPFAFDDELVRVLQDESGEPLFVAKDVCRALGYADASNPARLIAHVPEEWKGVNPIHTPGGEQDVLTLTEQGLYFFVARSDKPKALPFQKWLAGEVLPAIRKTGAYVSPAAADRFTIPPIPESLGLKPPMRQKLWSDALQTARLDGGGSEAAVRWFAELCRMVTARPSRLAAADGERLQLWQEQEALFDAFAAEHLAEDAKGVVLFRRLYDRFLAWYREAKPHSQFTPSKMALSLWLDRHGFDRYKRSGEATVYGLALREMPA